MRGYVTQRAFQAGNVRRTNMPSKQTPVSYHFLRITGMEGVVDTGFDDLLQTTRPTVVYSRAILTLNWLPESDCAHVHAYHEPQINVQKSRTCILDTTPETTHIHITRRLHVRQRRSQQRR